MDYLFVNFVNIQLIFCFFSEECLTRKTPEKAPGVTCPDCHRMQKAGGLRHHLDEECQFRSKPCPFCDVPYRARDLEVSSTEYLL